MFLTLAGAMSTAEMGISIAELIRQDKVHGICCTGANLEEDVFNLVAHSHYERIPALPFACRRRRRSALRHRGMNRVTDTCIPEERAIRKIEALDARTVAVRSIEAGESLLSRSNSSIPSSAQAGRWRTSTRSIPP